MIIKQYLDGSIKEVAQGIKEFCQNTKVKSIMMLACDDNDYSSDQLNPILQKSSKPIFGGVFPQIINNGKSYSKGTLLVGFGYKCSYSPITNLSTSFENLEGQLNNFFRDKDLEGNHIFVFVDSLSKRIQQLIEILFTKTDTIPSFSGGGAGSLSFSPKPCIICNDGLLEDAAILAMFNMPTGVGVAHGWYPITEPLTVTKSKKNRVIELNKKPALQVYKQKIENETGENYLENSFFSWAKKFPLGIINFDGEKIVRDPIKLQDNDLICIGEVPENSHIYILSGNQHSLVDGAIRAKKEAISHYHGDKKKSVLFFVDCISRALFLEDFFQKELDAVSNSHYIFGVLSLGEIARTNNSFLEFFNKTAVISLLGEHLD